MERTLAWRIAYRYFRGKGNANAVPILSKISMTTIAICSAAMIVLFSVFSGFETLLKNMYSSFYSDVKVTAAKGKFFPETAINMAAIKKIDGVLQAAITIEDNALAGDINTLGGSANRQKVVTVKGVENTFFKVNNLKDSIEGDKEVSDGHPYTAIVGLRIAQTLGTDQENDYSYINLYYPNPAISNPEADPLNAFQSLKVHPAGVFAVGDEFDDKYVLAPLRLVQELLHAEGKLSSVEIRTMPGGAEKVQQSLQKMLGNGFTVETLYEQNRTINMVTKTEKWAMYLILVFVMVIASFNMIGALTMVVFEKKKDIAILRAMGLHNNQIKNVFLLEGTFWALTGGLTGLTLGIVLCLLQQRFGFVKLGESFLINAYPVQIDLPNVVLVLATILVLGVGISWYPAIKATAIDESGLKST